jgi:hypothetical protein
MSREKKQRLRMTGMRASPGVAKGAMHMERSIKNHGHQVDGGAPLPITRTRDSRLDPEILTVLHPHDRAGAVHAAFLLEFGRLSRAPSQ